jgi:hypothetical protein
MVGFNLAWYHSTYGGPRLRGPAQDAFLRGEDPFAGVKTLAHMDLRRKALVDFPAAMFYAGGDPARVRCAYGDVAKAFDPAIDAAVALNCLWHDRQTEAALVARLAGLGWREAAARVWVAPDAAAGP